VEYIKLKSFNTGKEHGIRHRRIFINHLIRGCPKHTNNSNNSTAKIIK
jgi:hypothetical protein